MSSPYPRGTLTYEFLGGMVCRLLPAKGLVITKGVTKTRLRERRARRRRYYRSVLNG
jgi:hypothetical protein